MNKLTLFIVQLFEYICIFTIKRIYIVAKHSLQYENIFWCVTYQRKVFLDQVLQWPRKESHDTSNVDEHVVGLISLILLWIIGLDVIDHFSQYNPQSTVWLYEHTREHMNISLICIFSINSSWKIKNYHLSFVSIKLFTHEYYYPINR